MPAVINYNGRHLCHNFQNCDTMIWISGFESTSRNKSFLPIHLHMYCQLPQSHAQTDIPRSKKILHINVTIKHEKKISIELAVSSVILKGEMLSLLLRRSAEWNHSCFTCKVHDRSYSIIILLVGKYFAHHAKVWRK